MTIGWYAGTSPADRLLSLSLLREALKSGIIPQPRRCSICGFENTDDPSGRNYCQFHDESYVLGEGYPICRSCHGHLHRRWDRPRPWLRLITEYGDGTRWFELISMDPASLTRPFHETYPVGLPPA